MIDNYQSFLRLEDALSQCFLIYIKKDNLSIINKIFVNGTPDIIVEVISPGSIKIDRGWKKSTAEQHGVTEYWLINPLDDEVEIYTIMEKSMEKLVISIRVI